MRVNSFGNYGEITVVVIQKYSRYMMFSWYVFSGEKTQSKLTIKKQRVLILVWFFYLCIWGTVFDEEISLHLYTMHNVEQKTANDSNNSDVSSCT